MLPNIYRIFRKSLRLRKRDFSMRYLPCRLRLSMFFRFSLSHCFTVNA
jgi:hypothetical protein